MNNQNFKWQPFEKIGGKFGNITISINSAGGIGFLSGMWHKYNLQNMTYVKLFFSLDNSKNPVLGFKFTQDKHLAGVYKLTLNRSSASVSPNAFWAAHGIIPENYVGSYAPNEMIDKDFGQIFYIVLNKNLKLKNNG